jgi:site-specific DNA recombinase
MQFIAKMKYQGIRFIAVSQGIDTQNEEADVLLTVHGLVDSLYIKELAKKTHRGLEGRALNGEHTGGRWFGYDIVQSDDGKIRLTINEAEASIVRRIFEMSANGVSLKGITKTFNQEHIPPPRKRRGKKDGTWCHNAIREMLRNELYIGRKIWNRSKFVKTPGTNKRVRRERPRTEWNVSEQPELRIIDQHLWDRVQSRIAFVQKHYNFGNKPGLAPKAFTSPNLLTGLMKCGSCGANLIIVSGRGKLNHPRYGCPQNFNRGACTNGVKETCRRPRRDAVR